jgi:predicted PurR-regulated permease PerM
MSAAAGLLTYGLARATDVPGAAPLALWVALWDVVPLVGAFIGGVPIIVLAGVESTANAFLIAAAFLGYQIFETVFLQRPLHRRTVKVGPFLTVVSGLAGLELYGMGGALLLMLLSGVAVAAGDELAPESGEEAEPVAR